MMKNQEKKTNPPPLRGPPPLSGRTLSLLTTVQHSWIRRVAEWN